MLEIIWKEINSSPDLRTACLSLRTWGERFIVQWVKFWVAFTAFAFKTASLCTFGLIEAFPLLSFSIAYVENGCHLVKYYFVQFLRIALPYFPSADFIFAMLNCICLYCRFKRKFALTYLKKINFQHFYTKIIWNAYIEIESKACPLLVCGMYCFICTKATSYKGVKYIAADSLQLTGHAEYLYGLTFN